MKNKVVILSSGHPPKDERIYSKIGISLSNNNYSVVICTSTEELQTTENSIIFDCFNADKLTKREKINKFYSLLTVHLPDIIISAEPLPILAGHRFRKKINHSCKIISDITEWYPENYSFKLSGLKKWISYTTLFLFNIFVTNLADALLIGEENKKKRYDWIAPLKTNEIVSYFPRLEYFPLSNRLSAKDEINLGFTGILNEARGFHKILHIMEELTKRYSNVKWSLTLIGKFLANTDKDFYEKWKKANPGITINISPWQPYEQLQPKLNQVDLFMDLRKLNFIFNNSLPIKIFEYMASGKPVIYSKTASLLKFFGDFPFGKLVNPESDEEIIEAIEFYVFNLDERIHQGLLGRKLVEEKYQWRFCETNLLHFLEKIRRKLPA